MRIVTLLARHGIRDYPDAMANLDALFAVQLPDVERELVVVDNSLPEEFEKRLAPGRMLIGSSNVSWEFSAWDRGIGYLGCRINDYDFVHLATSAFRALRTPYLDLFDSTMLSLVLGGPATAVGQIDYYPEPVIVQGLSSQAWLRSSWVFLPPRDAELLGSLVSISDGSEFFSGHPHSPFRHDAPVSANYQQYIVDWQTGRGIWSGNNAWHSQFHLTTETLARFEAKTLAIMNEHMLSLRLRRQGCRMVDATWLGLRQAELGPGDPLGPVPGWSHQVAIRDA